MAKIFIILTAILFMTNVLARDPFQVATGSDMIGASPLQTAVIQLHYKNAENIAKLLSEKKSHFLSPQGHITADKMANTLWIQDNSNSLKRLKLLLRKIDKPAKQIQIEARIVNIDSNFARELGVEFGTTAPAKTGGLNMDIPVSSITTGHFNFVLAKLNNDSTLDVELSALESEGHAKVISRPKLITLNRQPANIAAGEDIPYQEKTGQGNTSVTFKKAVLSLEVIPSITANQQLELDIKVNQDKVSTIMVNGVPAIQTRSLHTHVSVKNKQTVVLGGIYEESKSNRVVRIPFLGSIPIIGALFRKTKVETERKELLIFITPTIIN